MDNIVPLLLFTVLCITTLSAADNISSCFVQDRSPAGQYSNIGRCTCTEAREKALERKKIRATEFVPICKKNGKFARNQTGQGNPVLFCVDEEFNVVGFGSDCNTPRGR